MEHLRAPAYRVHPMPPPPPEEMEAARPPATLTTAAVVLFGMGLLLFLSRCFALSDLIGRYDALDAFSGGAPLYVEDALDRERDQTLGQLMITFALMVLAPMARRGSAGARIAATVLMVLMGLGAVSLIVEWDTRDGAVAPLIGASFLVVFGIVAILLYWPSTNAFFRDVRRSRR